MRQGKSTSSRSKTLVLTMLCSQLAAIAGCSSVSFLDDPRWLFQREQPLVKRGDKFLAITGGACQGQCPHYEIYVFESGRVLFLGREFTQVEGLVESYIDPAGYQELASALREAGAFSWHPRLICKTDHPRFSVYSSRGGSVRSTSLDYGCDNQAKLLEKVEEAFVRISGTKRLFKPESP